MADQNSSDKGYGQLDPPDSGSAFTATSFLFDQMLSRISTMKPVKVMAVDSAAKTVDVQPMVSQTDGQNNVTPHGTIYGIPYLTWQFGVNAIIAAPAAGDHGIMVVSDRDMSAVKNTKDIAPPGSSRKMDASDGVYLGGILNKDATQKIEFSDDGIKQTDKNGNVIDSTSAGITINGVLFNRQGQVEGNLPVTGNLELGGVLDAVDGSGYVGNITTTGTISSSDGIFSGKSFNTHEHGYVKPSTGGTAAQTSPPT